MAKNETYPNRNAMHRNMGPPDSCDECGGRGWTCRSNAEGTDYDEVYCDCPAGRLRREVEK